MNFDDEEPVSADAEPDFVCKMVVIGDSGVGKSNLISRYTTGTFKEDNKETIGVEFGLKTFEIDGKVIKVAIWDTAGQDRFKVLTKGYYRGSHGAFIVYDITNIKSFENIEKWLDELLTSVDEDVQIMIVGNKIDLEDQRQVSESMAKRFAKEHSFSYIETSAKMEGPEGNVDKAFRTIVTEIFNKEMKKNEGFNNDENNNDVIVSSSPVVILTPPQEEPTQKTKKCCK